MKLATILAALALATAAHAADAPKAADKPTVESLQKDLDAANAAIAQLRAEDLHFQHVASNEAALLATANNQVAELAARLDDAKQQAAPK